MTISVKQMIENLTKIKDGTNQEWIFNTCVGVIDHLTVTQGNYAWLVERLGNINKHFQNTETPPPFLDAPNIIDEAIAALSAAPVGEGKTNVCMQADVESVMKLNNELLKRENEQPFDVLQHLSDEKIITDDNGDLFKLIGGEIFHRHNTEMEKDWCSNSHIMGKFLNVLSSPENLAPCTPEPVLAQIPATYTHDLDAEMYYFAPSERAPGPYLRQVKIEAMVDVASDGSFAGIEFDSAQIEQPQGGA